MRNRRRGGGGITPGGVRGGSGRVLGKLPGGSGGTHIPAGDPGGAIIGLPGRNQQAGGNQTGGGMTDAQQSAWDIMLDALNNWGLSSLAGVLKDLILDGTTDEGLIQLKLQQTDEWKTRFAGNEKLRAAGLPVLSVAEYLSVERSYAQIMKNYGLPDGFYDDPADFADFIGGSVSPSELTQRVQAYSDIAKREDPAITEQLQSMGLSEGDILAYIMDSSKAQPLIQKKYQQTLIGAAARRSGLTPDNDRLAQFADLGITEQQAIQGYGTIAEGLGTMQRLGDIYGQDYDLEDFEGELFTGDGLAAKKRKRLASQERAAFSGSAGVGSGSLSRATGGSY